MGRDLPLPMNYLSHLDVFSDDFTRYATTACDEIPPSPKMSAPHWTYQSLVFAQRLAGCLSLEPLDELGDGEMRRHGHEQMQVILGNVAVDNLDIHELSTHALRPSQSLIIEHGKPAEMSPYRIMKTGMEEFDGPADRC